MATYECDKCGMGVNATCAKCDAPLVDGSITTDNGTEFADHKTIAEKLDIDYYFAHPYASFERGSIEHLNGLVRQYVPKGTEFSTIDSERIKNIQHKLNNRPRKVLGFLSPLEYTEKATLLQLDI